MKGWISVTDIWKKVFNGSLDIPSDGKVYEGICLKEQGGTQIKVAVRSDSPEKLSCYVSTYEKHHIKRNISFDLRGIKGKKAVVGRDWGTGKFVRWSCSFQPSGKFVRWSCSSQPS